MVVLVVTGRTDNRQIATVGGPERYRLYLTTADSRTRITGVDTIVWERPCRLSLFLLISAWILCVRGVKPKQMME